MKENVIALIQSRAIPQLVENEPPDEDELVEIEEQLLMSLPYDLREFLLLVSHHILGAIEPVTATDPNQHTFLPEVAALAWDQGLPREYLPICQLGDNYYCINSSGEIYYWQAGELTDDYWENIWDWCEAIWLAN
ncbi:SMI1/KNR4 family protein [Aliikangiella maris]|uniref:SMI1/KNR4 family protein n=2 Tax=Aliikangiella maris TaxID=3162458 RepID=A0ABV2BSM3_9GAMM